MDTTERDQGLSRISRLTRWSIAASVGLAGLFSVLVAYARPAKSSATPPATTPAVVAPADSGTGQNSGGDEFLQPPAQPPSSRRGRGAVTSGAS